MNRVLVIGATGFTARYAIPALEAADFEVWRASHRLSPGPRALSTDITDIRSIEESVARARPTHVLHLAGTPNLPDSEAETLHALNVGGTAYLLEACARQAVPPRRIVLASSGYVYGDTGAVPATEDLPAAPVGEYGKSKAEMERVALRFSEKLGIVIARPFNYTGVAHAERFIIPKLAKVYRERGDDVSFADPEQVRDFSDVRWVADTYVRLLLAPATARVINVCSGTGRSLLEILDCFDAITGHHPLRAGRKPGSPRSPIQRLVGSAARLQALGFARSPYSLRDTLSWML